MDIEAKNIEVVGVINFECGNCGYKHTVRLEGCDITMSWVSYTCENCKKENKFNIGCE